MNLGTLISLITDVCPKWLTIRAHDTWENIHIVVSVEVSHGIIIWRVVASSASTS
jgi:hypothetical protein